MSSQLSVLFEVRSHILGTDFRLAVSTVFRRDQTNYTLPMFSVSGKVPSLKYSRMLISRVDYKLTPART